MFGQVRAILKNYPFDYFILIQNEPQQLDILSLIRDGP